MDSSGIGAPLRSIPACAGEPSLWISIRPLIGVYPRVCGGTGMKRTTRRRQKGLSPRVRGNRGLSLLQLFSEGSIPACAGEPLVNVIEHALLYSYLEYY